MTYSQSRYGTYHTEVRELKTPTIPGADSILAIQQQNSLSFSSSLSANICFTISKTSLSKTKNKK